MKTRTKTALAVIGTMLLSACGGKDKPERISAPPVAADWRTVVTNTDRERLQDWRSAFMKALDKAKAAGHGGSIAREGTLLDPDTALANPTPPAGTYRCRVIKLGSKTTLMGDYVVFPPAPCTISDEREVLSFSKLSGNQRPVGLLFPADGNRMIFLGTMIIGDESRALEYGRDSARDMAGAFDRVGPNRWRLMLPRPQFESMMDVIELVPAS
jgi:hypothetical protein